MSRFHADRRRRHGPATTGVVSVVSTTKIRYKAGSGHQNRVVITRSGNTITVDDRVAIKAVKGDKTKVRCTPAEAPTRIQVFAGDRNDRVENRTDLGMTARGDNGSDILIGGPRRDVLWGENGDDRLGGDDDLEGLGDNDRIWGGEGADRIIGSDGNDIIAAGGGFGTDTCTPEGIDTRSERALAGDHRIQPGGRVAVAG